MTRGRRLQHGTCAANGAGLKRRRVAAIHQANMFELGESGNGEVRAVRQSKIELAKNGPAKNGPERCGSAKYGLLDSREEDCKRAIDLEPVSSEPVLPEPVLKALPQPRSS